MTPGQLRKLAESIERGELKATDDEFAYRLRNEAALMERHAELERELAAKAEEIAKLKAALTSMYDKYEDGVHCHEGSDGDYTGAYIGNAVMLSDAEEKTILALIPKSRRDYPVTP